MIRLNSKEPGEWQQNQVTHCPKPKCKGMLLDNPYCHELKCSDCNQYYMQMDNLIETKEPKECTL